MEQDGVSRTIVRLQPVAVYFAQMEAIAAVLCCPLLGAAIDRPDCIRSRTRGSGRGSNSSSYLHPCAREAPRPSECRSSLRASGSGTRTRLFGSQSYFPRRGIVNAFSDPGGAEDRGLGGVGSSWPQLSGAHVRPEDLMRGGCQAPVKPPRCHGQDCRPLGRLQLQIFAEGYGL